MEWWIENDKRPTEQFSAVAYYRHSAQIGQENSVEIQQDKVRKFAKDNNLNIIEEFADRGKSGLNAEGRPAFNEMMEKVKASNDFQYILVLDMTRWGRFQETDKSAFYDSVYMQNGKQVIYTDIGIPEKDNQFITQLKKSLDRYQSAEYSRQLSEKVFAGCEKVASQGYRPGGSPPYGFHRLMLDENKKPDRILEHGQRKAIQNGRVILIPGESNEVEIIKDIYELFISGDYNEKQISGKFNSKGIPSPGGVDWTASMVRDILINEQYAGALVYNKTSQRLKSKRKRNPQKKWVVVPGAYEPIIAPEKFAAAQQIFLKRKRRFEKSYMLEKLEEIYNNFGVITSKIIQYDNEMPSTATYSSRFGSITEAFQAIHEDIRQNIRKNIAKNIANNIGKVTAYDDFLILNDTLSLKIQPSIPIPYGYGIRWGFRPDNRQIVDLTLGVPLSNTDSPEILGYLMMPRILTDKSWVWLSDSSTDIIDDYGYQNLEFISNLLPKGVSNE